MKPKLLAIAGAALLAACVHGQQAPPPINLLESSEKALAIADQAIILYAAYPICGTPNALLCKSPALLAKLKAGSQRVVDAINAARPDVLVFTQCEAAGLPACQAPNATLILEINAAIAALQADLASTPNPPALMRD